jgi:hypothetical protein
VLGRLRRDAWPVPLVVWLVEHMLPLVVASVMVAALLWGTVPNLFGFVPWTDQILAGTTLAVVAAVLWRPLRPYTIAAVTVGELGLAMTLLFVGSEVEALPRGAELLGSALHGTLWLCYVAAHLLADMVRHLHRILTDMRAELARARANQANP